jgi:hypothetical protein
MPYRRRSYGKRIRKSYYRKFGKKIQKALSVAAEIHVLRHDHAPADWNPYCYNSTRVAYFTHPLKSTVNVPQQLFPTQGAGVGQRIGDEINLNLWRQRHRFQLKVPNNNDVTIEVVRCIRYRTRNIATFEAGIQEWLRLNPGLSFNAFIPPGFPQQVDGYYSEFAFSNFVIIEDKLWYPFCRQRVGGDTPDEQQASTNRLGDTFITYDLKKSYGGQKT